MKKQSFCSFVFFALAWAVDLSPKVWASSFDGNSNESHQMNLAALFKKASMPNPSDLGIASTETEGTKWFCSKYGSSDFDPKNKIGSIKKFLRKYDIPGFRFKEIKSGEFENLESGLGVVFKLDKNSKTFQGRLGDSSVVFYELKILRSTSSKKRLNTLVVHEPELSLYSQCIAIPELNQTVNQLCRKGSADRLWTLFNQLRSELVTATRQERNAERLLATEDLPANHPAKQRKNTAKKAFDTWASSDQCP